jgi:hypothetical protein
MTPQNPLHVEDIRPLVQLKESQSLVYRLRTRAQIRRNIQTRKSVQEGKPDKLADLLEEAAKEIKTLQVKLSTTDMLLEREKRAGLILYIMGILGISIAGILGVILINIIFP